VQASLTGSDLAGMVHMDAASAQASQPFPGKLYSYVVTHDTGFAPNPFFGHCTLACCKPEIRRTAQIGDWVVGLTPKADGNRVVYFMQIDEILESFDLYWNDRRFATKKPRYDAAVELKCGDNIYELQGSGEYRQHRSMHSHQQGEGEDPEKKAHDLGGIRVLVSETFAYFGAMAIALPPELDSLIVGRAHKCRFPDEVKAEFRRFVGSIGLGGVRAAPRKWPSDKGSCVKGCASSVGITR